MTPGPADLRLSYQFVSRFLVTGMTDAPASAVVHPAPPKKEAAMTRSFNVAHLGQIVTAVVLASAASALTLGGALLAVVS